MNRKSFIKKMAFLMPLFISLLVGPAWSELGRGLTKFEQKLREAKSYEEIGEHKKAEEVYQRLIKEYAGTPYAHRIQHDLVILYIRHKSKDNADKALDQLIAELSSHPPKLANTLSEMAYEYFLGGLTGDVDFLRKATELWERLVKEFPNHHTIPSVYYYIGLTHRYIADLLRTGNYSFASEEYKKAIESFQKLIDLALNSPYAPKAQFWIEKIYEILQEGEEHEINEIKIIESEDRSVEDYDVEEWLKLPDLKTHTGWEITSSLAEGCFCFIERTCPDGSRISCGVSGLWGCSCLPATCKLDGTEVPGVKCYAFPGQSSFACCPAPCEASVGISEFTTTFQSIKYLGRYEHILYKDTLFAVKPFLSSYQISAKYGEVFYYPIGEHTLYTPSGDSLQLDSVDGIMKVEPISYDKLIIASPTGVYRYTLSTNDVEKLGKYNDIVLLDKCVKIELPYIVISTFSGIKVFLYEGDKIRMISHFQPEMPPLNVIKYDWQKHYLYMPIVTENKIILSHLSSPYIAVYDMKGNRQSSISFDYPDYINQLNYIDTTCKVESSCESCCKIKSYILDATLIKDNILLLGLGTSWFIVNLKNMEVSEVAFYDENHNGTVISQVLNANNIKLVNVLPLIMGKGHIEISLF